MKNQSMTTFLCFPSFTRDTLAIACAIGATLAASSANAADAVSLQPHESKGFGDSSVRMAVGYAAIKGTIPVGTATSDTYDFSRSGFVADFDFMGFWDATRFDTLIGAEANMRIGSLGVPSYSDPAAPKPGEHSAIVFRTEAAFDYALMQFGEPRDFHGRVIFGAGAGVDYDGNDIRGGDDGFRAYPMLILRGQLFFSESMGIHLSIINLPTTTGSLVQRENRFEASFAIEHIHAGIRLIRETTHKPDSDESQTTSTSNQYNLFLGYAF